VGLIATAAFWSSGLRAGGHFGLGLGLRTLYSAATNTQLGESWMDLKIFTTVFATILVAELGDKTQLATLLYASQARNPRLTVFLAAASALVIASAVGVLAGSVVSRHVNPKTLSWIAGLGFIGIGFWTILRA
jgi:putative Ca2+/H+ antiporter (TMEM165/GDT1 family)